MSVAKMIGCVSMLGLAACAQENTSTTSEEAGAAPDLAADTANLPNVDIFLARLSLTNEIPQLSNLRNVTMAAGYDNQPSFLPGAAAFYFVSEGEGGKTDIWKYDIGADEKSRVYHSPTVSEYSPKAAPKDFGISYIQENEAGDMTRVHHAPVSGGVGEAVVSFAPLGYYTWLNDATKLGVFLRGDPATLQLVNIASGDVEEIAENIGRSLQATPDGNGLYFTQGGEGEVFNVLYLDLADNSTAHVTGLPAGSQDYFIVFSSEGHARTMFAGAGSVLYFLDMSTEGAAWREVADYAFEGLNNLSRISVSDDAAWITLVAEAQ
ncbi:MAG: hypothetical protein JKX88_02070 [Marinicaulis sp.]|nr:hypothetical protein [Marinicaulis sp.]